MWERVAHKLRSGQMPPFGRPRPDKGSVDAFVAGLERSLDEAAARGTNPGRPVTHRMTRTEYTNAVRDLLALDIDARSLLPADDTDQHGFDNNAEVLSISPSLLERYLSAARTITRMAVGRPPSAPAIETYTVPAGCSRTTGPTTGCPSARAAARSSTITSPPTATTPSPSGCRRRSTTRCAASPILTSSSCG